mmetsp:Transcript_41731/g.104291  ORF Transcript_41731/g.104291 Transcript_41731/m.104291 type:complete len:221 (-) Transcript_41731:18-680(-)
METLLPAIEDEYILWAALPFSSESPSSRTVSWMTVLMCITSTISAIARYSLLSRRCVTPSRSVPCSIWARRIITTGRQGFSGRSMRFLRAKAPLSLFIIPPDAFRTCSSLWLRLTLAIFFSLFLSSSQSPCTNPNGSGPAGISPSVSSVRSVPVPPRTDSLCLPFWYETTAGLLELPPTHEGGRCVFLSPRPNPPGDTNASAVMTHAQRSDPLIISLLPG